ncbi:MAG: NAD(P)H-dependent oxidoreductase [Candidatus Saccharimonadales bacterium]
MTKTVLALSGSLRKESISTKLLRAFEARRPAEINFVTADLSPLPIYNQDDELPEPDFLLTFKRQILAADGILLITPEYNRSIPPVLKNALDWASRPQAPVGHGSWGGKPTAIAGCSPYSLGAFGAVHHLRQVLTFLNMPTLQQPEFYLSFAGDKFDEAGKLVDEVTIQHVDKFWTAFVDFMNKLNSPKD